MLLRFQRDLSRVWVTAVRFHDPRHTFGTRMAAAGVPLCTLAEWMGHRDFKTMIYADYQPSDQEAELVERAFGGSPSPTPRSKRTNSQRSLTLPRRCGEDAAALSRSGSPYCATSV